MGDPVASISVPKDEREKFKQRVPIVLEMASSADGKSVTLSGLVQRVIFDSQILDKVGLQNFASKEQLTSRTNQ
jgi:hypothetical protein